MGGIDYTGTPGRGDDGSYRNAGDGDGYWNAGVRGGGGMDYTGMPGYGGGGFIPERHFVWGVLFMFSFCLVVSMS